MGTGAGNFIFASNTIAIGTNARAAADHGLAMGTNTVVQMPGGVALGADSNGNGAVSTLENQFVMGTKKHTYTAPGITSDLSRNRQNGGPLELVTSDSDGNLATDGGDTFETLDEHASGIALAMSMENPDLVGTERFGIAANWGHFDGANALSVSAMGVLGYDVLAEGDRVALSGGIGVGFENGQGDATFGGRVGLQWTR
jgi:hypothetical protein